MSMYISLPSEVVLGYTVPMFSQKTLTTTALIWVPLAIVFSGAVALAYTAGQQNYRQSLNDPQIQITEEAATMLKNGQTIQSLVPTERIDVATSLVPFIIFYDDTGRVILGSGVLNGTTPTPPSGVFSYTKAHGQDRLTWQPQAGIRIATVLRRTTGTTNGFVLAGRSMREVEIRIDNLSSMALIVWFVGLATSLAATLGIAHLREKKS